MVIQSFYLAKRISSDPKELNKSKDHARPSLLFFENLFKLLAVFNYSKDGHPRVTTSLSISIDEITIHHREGHRAFQFKSYSEANQLFLSTSHLAEKS